MYRLEPFVLLAVALSLVGCADLVGGDPGQTADLEHTTHRIFGGVEVGGDDPVAGASVALLEGDGDQVCSGTLLAPDLVVSAAHCFTSFTPYYTSFGVEAAHKTFWTDDYSDRRKFPNVREIVSHTVHPDYDPSVTGNDAEELRAANDIAIARLDAAAPAGYSPAAVLAASAELPSNITLAGFGAFPSTTPTIRRPRACARSIPSSARSCRSRRWSRMARIQGAVAACAIPVDLSTCALERADGPCCWATS